MQTVHRQPGCDAAQQSGGDCRCDEENKGELSSPNGSQAGYSYPAAAFKCETVYTKVGLFLPEKPGSHCVAAGLPKLPGMQRLDHYLNRRLGVPMCSISDLEKPFEAIPSSGSERQELALGLSPSPPPLWLLYSFETSYSLQLCKTLDPHPSKVEQHRFIQPTQV